MKKSWIEKTAEALKLIPTIPQQGEVPRLAGEKGLRNYPPPEQ